MSIDVDGYNFTVKSYRANGYLDWTGNFSKNPLLSVILSINPNLVTVGRQVTMTANVSGGVQPYSFNWT